MPLADAQSQLMDDHQAKVLSILEQAERNTAPGLLGGLFDASELDQERGAVAQCRELYTAWADAESANGKRKWAEDGHRDDGAPYSVDDWMSLGDTLGQGASYAAQQSYESGYWKAAYASLVQTTTDIKNALPNLPNVPPNLTDPSKWPLKVKIALGVGAGVAALIGVNLAVRYVRAAAVALGVA